MRIDSAKDVTIKLDGTDVDRLYHEIDKALSGLRSSNETAYPYLHRIRRELA